MAPRETKEEKLRRESEQATAAVTRLSDAVEGLRERTAGSAEELSQFIDAELDAAKAALALSKQLNDTAGIIEHTEHIRKLSRESEAYAEAAKKAEDRAKAFASAGEDLGQELAGLIPIIGGNVDYMDTFGGKLAMASANAGGFVDGLGDVAGGFAAMFNPTQLATNMLSFATEGVMAWVGSAVEMSMATQAATANFNRATGMMGQYNGAMMGAFRSTTQAGASYEDAAESFETLILTTSRFTDMVPAQQQALAETSLVLDNLGIDLSTSAANLHIMTTSLNMTAGEAETTSRRLVSAAHAMGVAPAEMAADFASAGAQFASFGDQAVDAFIDLKEVAKKTGIELQGLLSITEKFTTFEGAADHVGKLNALLGGSFLNTVDMVTLSLEDPAAAMQEVRNAVLDAGLSFESMNPAMRRAVASAAGLEDAGQLAALMSGELDGLGSASSATADQLEDLKEATKFTQTLSDELEATRLAFTANFSPIIEGIIIPVLDKLQGLASFLNDTFHPNAAAFISLAGFMLMGKLAFWQLSKAIATTTAPITALTGEMAALNGTLGSLALEAVPASGGIKTVGTAAATAGTGLMSMALAVLAIGAGIGIAAAGLALFVYSFSFLTGDQLFYAAVGLVALAAGFAVLIGTMMFFAQPLGAAAVAGLLAVGGAVALIGIGIAAAAAGMALLVASIGTLAATAEDFAMIGEAFENLSIPKMIVYTTAMTATAMAGMTPAGVVVAAMAGAAGGGGGAATTAAATKVEVKINGSLRKLFKVLDKRYVQGKSVAPGKISNNQYQ